MNEIFRFHHEDGEHTHPHEHGHSHSHEGCDPHDCAACGSCDPMPVSYTHLTLPTILRV